MTAERSPQQLDPLGTLAGWTLTPLGGVVAFGYAVLSTIWHRDQQAHPVFTAVALTLLLAAIVVLIACAAPRRAPMRRPAFVVVLVLAASAAVFSAVGTWGLDRLVQDDWGQISFAVLLVSMTQLRPPADLAVAAGAGAVVLGTASAIPAAHYAITVGPLIYAIVAATPVLLLGLGAMTYARVMVRTTERWQRSARDGMARLEPDVRATARRTVRQEQITILNAEAVPLFTRLIERGEITEMDVDDAANLAQSLRRHALRLVHGGWLDDTLRRAGIDSDLIDDPDDVLSSVTNDQRAALGAYITTLARLERAPRSLPDAGSVAGSGAPVVRVSVAAGATPSEAEAGDDPAAAERRARLVCSAELTAPHRVAKRALMPYLSVLRVVSHDARLRIRDNTITLGFGYDTV